MRHPKLGSFLAAFAAIVLTACGGGGGDSGGSSGGKSNKAPIANAGALQVVAAGALVTLNGSASSDPDGTIASYAWTQTAGSAVTLTGASNAQPTFTAPSLGTETTLRFSLVVTDNRGATSTPSTVQIIVNAVAGNVAPIADAGNLQSTTSGTAVMLNGAASTDLDGSIVSYAWTQTAGPAVTLSSAAVALPSFIAPPVAGTETLTFSLVVTDDDGAASTPSIVHITVNPGTPGNVNIAGKVRFERVRFTTTAPRPLDYANPVLQPARGVTIRALNAVGEAVISTSWTDMNGDYSLSVPANLNVIVEVEARMQKTGPAPTWDMRVQNGVPGTSPYTHRTASFNSDTGVTRYIDIATGVNASGQATDTRASAPFAILDTLYTGMQFIMGAAPTASFPVLVVDWGTQNQGTFFSTFGGQHIALLSDLSEDTDEFDQHVIAHEFGHYIEYNFSRADNIGGQHGLGDRLDPRVAFGEGFGYAFAAMVLNDPMARDSFVNNGTLVSGGFNVETNPTTNPPGAGSDREGCWCSESSVWSILYDLYDDAADGADTLSLGFTPIWKVLVGPQRTTPAFTTIFSFITALKAERPSDIAAINALVAAQNIDAATIDAFATTETHFPSNVAQTAALPLYTTMSLNSTATLLNVNDAGRYNKLGNHRWVRFTVPAGGRSVTITLATSNATDNDPDFLLWQGGNFVGASENPPPGPETQTFDLSAGNYLLDVYDCTNGCTTAQGTAGDYNLTVTLSAP